MSRLSPSDPVLATIGQLGHSGYLLVQMNSGRSSEPLHRVWAPGPGPQLLSQPPSYSAECEYSFSWPHDHGLIDVCVAASGVYIGAEGPLEAQDVHFTARIQCNMSLMSATSMCHCLNEIM